jgi:hypothetical protein
MPTPFAFEINSYHVFFCMFRKMFVLLANAHVEQINKNGLKECSELYLKIPICIVHISQRAESNR